MKRLRGTLRPDRERVSAATSALVEWPPVPRGFTLGERAAWDRLGEALLPLQTVGGADLELVRLAAVAIAAAERARHDPEAKATSVTAAVRLAADLLHRLGLGPLARGQVEPIPRQGGVERILRMIEGGGS